MSGKQYPNRLTMKLLAAIRPTLPAYGYTTTHDVLRGTTALSRTATILAPSNAS